MPDVREWNQGFNGAVDFLAKTIGSVDIVGGDVLPDFFQILDCVGVKNKLAHERERRCLLLC